MLCHNILQNPYLCCDAFQEALWWGMNWRRSSSVQMPHRTRGPHGDGIARLIAALPSDGATVTLTREDLVLLRSSDHREVPVNGDLTVKDVAVAVHRSESTVRGWLVGKRLTGYKLNGREWRIPRASLDQFLADQGRSPRPNRESSHGLRAWRDVRRDQSPASAGQGETR